MWPDVKGRCLYAYSVAETFFVERLEEIAPWEVSMAWQQVGIPVAGVICQMESYAYMANKANFKFQTKAGASSLR